MRIAPRDAVMDGIALVTAYLKGDAEGFNSVLDCCDSKETAHALAAVAAGLLRGAIAAQAGQPMPEDGERDGDEVLEALARVRDNLAAQYDGQARALWPLTRAQSRPR